VKVKKKPILSFSLGGLCIFPERNKLLDDFDCSTQIPLILRQFYLYHLEKNVRDVGFLEVFIHRESRIHRATGEIVFIFYLILFCSEYFSPLRNAVDFFTSSEYTDIFFSILLVVVEVHIVATLFVCHGIKEVLVAIDFIAITRGDTLLF